MKNFSSEKYWYLKQLNIFMDLSNADAYSLERIISYKGLKHEERICEQGVYFIKEGRIKITEENIDEKQDKEKNRKQKADSEENTETKVVLEQGEIFGVFSDEASIDAITYAECLSEVCLGIATIRDFSFFLKRKSHLTSPLDQRTLFNKFNDSILRGKHKNQQVHFSRHNILTMTSTPDRKKFNALDNIVFRTVSSRLALLLQNLASVSDSKGVVLVPRLSTKRLSKLIGSTQETIDKLLETFKQHQVIQKCRGRIQILNAWKLKQISDASMKTLTPQKEVSPISDEDFDLETLISGQVAGESESASVINV